MRELTLSGRLPNALMVTEAEAFSAIRAAQALYPAHTFKLVGPFGLRPRQVYRLHAHGLTGDFDGFVCRPPT